MKNHEDVLAIVEELKKLYPEGLCSLQYPKPYELLFSVRLAAQCCLLYTSDAADE